MERITRQNVETRCDNLNRRMEELDCSIRYRIQSRDGRTMIDRFDLDGRHLDTVRAGTKSESAEFLHAMMVALDDAKLYTA